MFSTKNDDVADVDRDDHNSKCVCGLVDLLDCAIRHWLIESLTLSRARIGIILKLEKVCHNSK